MTKFLIRHCIKNYKNTEDSGVRAGYIMLSGIMGICCNTVLFVLKLIIGMMMNSMAIISDAFNNLSDLSTSAISSVSAKLSQQLPDRDHPFGHGRMEYVASLTVSFVIMAVGLELLRTSLSKLMTPDELRFSWISIIILAASMLIKVWMYVYNRHMGARISSPVLRAAAADSISDVMATAAVVAATVLSQFWKAPFSIDGAMGLVVSVLILKAGFSCAKDTVNILLGSPPDPILVKKIDETVAAGDGIVGVHDLMVHDYGPGRCFASVHAEVPDDGDMVHVHEVIDAIEQEVYKETGTVLVIHMDPVRVGDDYVDAIQMRVREIIGEVEPAYTIHDFRITDGKAHINLIFDMVVPCDEKPDAVQKNVALIKQRITEDDSRFATVIQIDRDMT